MQTEMQYIATDSTHLLDLPPHVLCLAASFVKGDKAALRSSCRCLRDVMYGMTSISLRGPPKPDKPEKPPTSMLGQTHRPGSDLHEQLHHTQLLRDTGLPNQPKLPHDIEPHGGWLQELPVSLLAKCPCLTSIKVSGTQLVWLPMADLSPLGVLTTLQSVDCSHTKVADLSPLVALESLRSLDCQLTYVADLSPLTALAALSSLDCHFTKVKDLSPLSAVTALRTLNVSLTSVQDLSPLAALKVLEILDFRLTRVFDLTPLAAFQGLKELCFDGDPDTQISHAMDHPGFKYSLRSSQLADLTPVSRLVTLQSLDCSDTSIVDLSPLAGLQSLRTLDCSRTRVKDLTPLSALTALQLLDCSDTCVRYKDLKPLKAALASLKISSLSIFKRPFL